MQLKAYIQSERGNATALADALGIPLSYLSQMSSGERAITAERASAIELHTQKAVTRQDLRPDDWQAIWPELIKVDTAPVTSDLPIDRTELVEAIEAGLITDERKQVRRAVDKKAV